MVSCLYCFQIRSMTREKHHDGRVWRTTVTSCQPETREIREKRQQGQDMPLKCHSRCSQWPASSNQPLTWHIFLSFPISSNKWGPSVQLYEPIGTFSFKPSSASQLHALASQDSASCFPPMMYCAFCNCRPKINVSSLKLFLTISMSQNINWHTGRQGNFLVCLLLTIEHNQGCDLIGIIRTGVSRLLFIPKFQWSFVRACVDPGGNTDLLAWAAFHLSPHREKAPGVHEWFLHI